MQTTLLAVAIALILALVTALVGPLLVDWGTYRSLFEAEATRLAGVQVAVKGEIDARLLPTPRLTLHDIEIGGAGGDTMHARVLDVELALGSLLRGEWRATELRLTGPQLRLGLDASGHLAVPSRAVGFRPEALAIDRLSIADGKVTLADAASGGSVTLDNVYFNGVARSLLGPFRGEGEVVVGGDHYPYRLATGAYGSDDALTLRLNVDPRDQPLNFETSGTLAFEAGAPRFEGVWSLLRPAGIGATGAASLNPPWRLGGKIKASESSALMENIEFLYGAEDHGIKLTGVGNLRFGKKPSFEAVLSGHQIDLDRALTGDDSSRSSPGAAVRKLTDLARGAFRPVMPLQIGIGIDQVTLAGGVVQNLRGDVSAGANGWELQSFEFRAPGFTQARLSGHLDVSGKGVTFTGPAEIDSSDPRALAAWLEGRDPAQGEPRSLRLRGDVTLGVEQIALDRLTAEFAGRTIAGRFAYVFAAGTHPSRVDAALNAPELDLDALLGFGRAVLAGSQLERPHDMAVTADIGHATIAGLEGRNLSARVKVDADSWEIDRLTIADLGGAKFAAKGRIVLAGPAPQGDIAVDFDAPDMQPMMKLLAHFAPKTAQALDRSVTAMAPARLHAQLTAGGTAGEARLALTGKLGPAAVSLNGDGRIEPQQFQVGAVNLDGKLSADDGKALVAMLGFGSAVAVTAGPAALTLRASGPANGTLQVKGRLTAAGLEVESTGSANLLADAPQAALDLRIAQADAAPLRGTGPLPVAGTATVSLRGNDLSLSDVSATVAGSLVRAHLAIGLAQPHAVTGEIDADTAAGASLVAAALGAPAGVPAKEASLAWPSAPFAGGLFGSFAGTVAVKVRSLELLPRLTVREFRANVRLGARELSFDDVVGVVSGGKLAGAFAFRSKDSGLNARGKVTLNGAEVAPLLPAAARPPASGLLDLSLALEGAGFSPAALIGSLHGSGTLALRNAQLAGLDPRVFAAVTRAVDQGLPLDSVRISDAVRNALDSGQLSIKQVSAALAVNAGQIRLTDFTAKDANLALTASLDLIDGALDARLVLSAGAGGPDLFVGLQGPWARPARSIDVTALTGWLTLRAVESETRRVKALEDAAAKAETKAPSEPSRGPPLVPPPIAAPPQAAPALPAPIYVNPLPAPREPKPEASVSPQH